jgi:hypothetical protein
MGKLIDKLLHSRKNRREPSGIKSFKAQQQLDEAFSERDMGMRPVPLKQVVGSVGRYQDFDSRFRLKKALPPERFQTIRSMLVQGRRIPPVKLFQIKNEFYVLDGNHRVAAAKELGREYIDAHIVEFLPSKNSLENILYREKVAFRDKTGLTDAIDLTEVGQYTYLINQITEHQDYLASSLDKPPLFKDAATDWYRSIYHPLMSIIEKSRLSDSFPGRTTSDLYTYISYHQWELGRKRKYGIGIDRMIPKDMEAFRTKMANMKDIDLPEMQRNISAFVLMTVKAGKEMRVMEKLFEMDEVMEVHSVHGEFDLITRIGMTRDLLSSDAEVIGNVVYKKVRRIPDVLTTQTLIPSTSLLKERE